MQGDDRRRDEPQPGSIGQAAARLAALSWAAAGLFRIRRRLPARRAADTSAYRLAVLSLLAAGTFRSRRRVAPATQRLRSARRAAGLCPDCGGSPKPGRVRCAECLSISAETARYLRAARRGAGLCWRCGAPSEHFTACEACRTAERTRDASRRAARRERKSRTALLVALSRQWDRVRKS